MLLLTLVKYFREVRHKSLSPYSAAVAFFLKNINCYKIIEFAGSLANSNQLIKIAMLVCCDVTYSQQKPSCNHLPILTILMQILIPICQNLNIMAHIYRQRAFGF